LQSRCHLNILLLLERPRGMPSIRFRRDLGGSPPARAAAGLSCRSQSGNKLEHKVSRCRWTDAVLRRAIRRGTSLLCPGVRTSALGL